MDINYDEDLSKNSFFEGLKKDHYLILQLAIHEGWIICVPRRDTFMKDFLSEQDANEHILVANEDFSNNVFETLSNKKVFLRNGVLTVQCNATESYSLHLLFEETFYCDNLRKYRVWCIERPMDCKSIQLSDELTVITNLYDAKKFLWTKLQQETVTNLELSVKEYLKSHAGIENKSLQTLKSSLFSLYSRTIKEILKDKRLSNSSHLLQNVKVSVETYILHALHEVLPKLVAVHSALEDATLNKMIRNVGDLRCKDLGMRTDLCDNVQRSKLELSRLLRYTTVLEKLECLKRSIRYISHGMSSVSSDDLLPVLVYVIVKTGLPNWIAQVIFIKTFRFSADFGSDADENAYIVTTLEAAIEYIKSGALAANYKTDLILKETSRVEENLEKLFKYIQNGELPAVDQLLSTKVDLPSNTSMCHPLCVCESCETFFANRLSNRPTVSSRNEHKVTALHVAAFYGQVAIVDYLLTHGADPNAIDSNSTTPLHCAASRGRQNIVLLLLHANANPRIGNVHGDTALHVAADCGHEGCVKALLYFAEHTDLWIDVNSVNLIGDSPLHRASKWGYLGIIEVLLEYGADCKVKNKWGQTSFDIAHSEKVIALFQRVTTNSILKTCSVPCGTIFKRPSHTFQEMLFEEDKMKERCSNQVSVTFNKSAKLFAAVMEGDVNLANYYLGLDVGGNKTATNLSSNLCHPLCDCKHCAPLVDFYKIKKVPTVIFNLYNDNGETILHVACATGCVEIVRLLLDAGANVNVKTKCEGRTPLHLASVSNNVHVIKIILRCATCNVDAKDFNGDTALHLAARRCNTKIMKLLIRTGANTVLRNLNNITALLELEKQMSKDVIFQTLKCNALEYSGYFFTERS